MTLRQREPRQKDPAYLDYIRSLACCVCGDNTSTEAAHIRTASLEYGARGAGMQEKSSDKWALPLCSECHREQHSMNEMAFWKSYNINPFLLALKLRTR